MSWTGLFRRRPRHVGRHAAGSTQRPGAPRELRPPPEINGGSQDAVTASGVPDSSSAELPSAGSRVHLGFSDGTSLEIGDGTGESQALQEVASRLINEQR